MVYMPTGIVVGSGMGGRQTTPNTATNMYGTQGYNEPVTGAASPFPTVGVGPETQYNAAYGLKSQEMSEKAASDLSAQNAKQAADARNSIFSQFGSTGGTQPTAQYGGADFTAAQNAAFARAKDQAGQISKSAITGLRDSMAARGTLGSGIEGEDTARILAGQAGGLSDVNREQMIQAAGGAQHAADIQYQGDITQRGQNQQAINALLSLMSSAGRAY